MTPHPTENQALEPAPVLKWAGGKRRLLAAYERRFPKRFGAYFEPFVGGGAVYFWLYNRGHLDPKRARLTDINPELVNFYRAVQGRVEALILATAEHQKRHSRDHYYEVRALEQETLAPVERASRLLYLNRTCFNGLYRENSSGRFNVPMGRYKNPRIVDPEGLRAASRALRGVTLEVAPYQQVEELAQPGDLVYFDPPYHPLNPTSNFTGYTRFGFTADDQRELAALFGRLAERGVQVRLSNSSAPLIRELYQPFKQHRIRAPRAINSKGDRRAEVLELLIAP